MTPQSEKTLAPLYPVFAAKVRAAAATLEPEVYLLVYSGLRTAQEQNADYMIGRTLPGRIVTQAKAGESMHNYGLAADIVPYLQGDTGAPDWNTESTPYVRMVMALKAQGLAWGGDWKYFKDMDHFQLAGLPPTPDAQMQADYAGGLDLESIWNKVAEGAYV